MANTSFRKVLFSYGNQAEYDELECKDPCTLYWIEDTQRIYKGKTLYAVAATATEENPGLMSVEDKTNLDILVNAGVTVLTSPDNTVEIGTTEINGVKYTTIDVSYSNIVSAENDNLITINNDGLSVLGAVNEEDENLVLGAIKE